MALYTETFAEWVAGGGEWPAEFGRWGGLQEAFYARYCARELGYETEALFALKFAAMAAEAIPEWFARRVAFEEAEGDYENPVKKTTSTLGATRGTSSELPFSGAEATPSVVSKTDEVVNTVESSGLTPAEVEAKAEFLGKIRGFERGCLDAFEPLFMQVF